MNEVADGVFQIPLMPRNGVNAYLLGDLLVDAGLKSSAGKVLKAVEGRTVRAHVLTHAHLDHAGGSKKVAGTLGVPVWVGANDADALRTGTPVVASGPLKGVLSKGGTFPGVEPARSLADGDDVGGGFVALDAPGHSPGQMAFWREGDRTLVLGDVYTNMNLLTTAVGLHMPPGPLTVDPAQNRRSAKRLADLGPAVVCFGHGPVLTDGAKLQAFAAKLAA